MSDSRGFTPWIVRENGRRRAVIGWQFPDSGGGAFGGALKVTDGGSEILAVMKPFRLAVPLGNLLLSSQRASDELASAGEASSAGVDEPAAAVVGSDSPPVFVHEVQNIRAEVLPTVIANPPGYRVRIHVDGRHIVDVFKDVNVIVHPDGTTRPAPPYDLQTAIARAKSMVADLHDWHAA